MANVNCQVETRRLMDRGAASVGRGPINIDNLDSCSEHLAGLGAALCATLFVWVLAIPFFDLGTIQWVKSWEAPLLQGMTHPPITLAEFKRRMSTRYSDARTAHASMDSNNDELVDFHEFAKSTKKFVPPLNETEAGYAFSGLDLDQDSKLGCDELEDALSRKRFPSVVVPFSATTTSTSTLTTTVSPSSPPATTANATARAPYDCGAGLRSAATGWTEAKQEWCCHHEHRGCSALSLTTTATATTTVTLTTASETVTLTETMTETATKTTTTRSTTTLTQTATLTTSSMTPTQSSSTSPLLDAGPVSMEEFKKRMGPALRDSPRDAFAALDQNNDERSQLDEFVKATESLNPPLSIMQAEDIFARLDINRDSEVEAMEFFAAFEAGKFQEPMHSTQKPITMAEYHQRMGHASQVAAVLIDLPSVDTQGLSDEERAAIGDTLVAVLAKQAMVPKSSVKDLDGKPASISHSAAPTGQSHVAKGRIDVPSDEISDDVIRVITDYSTRQELAARLAQVGHHVNAAGIRISARKQNSNAFMTIDADHDGVLNEREFVDATGKFSPPLTQRQALYAFNGLDADRDERLSAVEYEGYGVDHFFESPQMTTGRPPQQAEPRSAAEVEGHGLEPIGLRDFRQRLGRSFRSPQDAFQSLDRNSDGFVDAEEHFTGTGEALQPPLQRIQAEYSFQGLDADHDDKVTAAEFLKVMHIGHFFPDHEELEAAEEPPITMADFNSRMEGARPEGSPTVDHATASPTPLHQLRKLEGSPLSSFLKLDVNSDGVLDLNEFVKATQAFDPPLTRNQAEYAFAGFDSNHDRRVSSKEFIGDEQVGHFFQPPAEAEAQRATAAQGPQSLAAFKSRVAAAYDSPSDAFLALDADRDGSLQRTELAGGAGPSSGALAGTGADAQRDFQLLDADHDGRVAFDEFAQTETRGEAGPAATPNPGQERTGSAGAPVARAERVRSGPQKSSIGQGPPGRVHAAAAITLADFEERMRGTMTKQDAFLKWDVNSDGFLDLGEFSRGSATLAPSLTEEEAQHAFQGLDANHDGKVCVTEFFGTLRLGHFFQSLKALAAVGAGVKKVDGAGGTVAPPPSTSRAPATPPAAPAVAADAARADAATSSPPHPSQPTPAHPQAPPEPISCAELQARMSNTDPREAFRAMDRDSDGELSLGELDHSAQAFSPPLSGHQVKYAFRGLDSDDNGEVSAQEFSTVLAAGSFFQSPAAPRLAGPAAVGAASALEDPPPITVPSFVKSMRSLKYAKPLKAFQAQDKNEDGFLDLGEFFGFAPPLTRRQAEYAFRGFDTDRDAAVSIKEFFGVLAAGKFFQTPEALEAVRMPLSRISMADFKERMTAVAPEDAFGALDKNADGLVERSEFVSSTKAFVPPLTREQAKYAFQALDADHSGKLCSGEFVGALKLGDFFQTPAALKAAGYSLAETPAPPKPEPEQVREQASRSREPGEGSGEDEDDGEHISVPSFVRHMASSHLWPHSAFHKMRTRGNDCVNLREFAAGTSSFALPLTRREAEGAFEGFDADGDGSVCFAEFVGAIRTGSFATKKQLHEGDNTLGTASQRPSGHSTGHSSAGGPITAAKLLHRMGAVTPKEAFSEMDIDGSGFLSLNELAHCAKFFSPPLTKEQAAHAFEGLDTNHDGEVDAEEFEGVLTLGRFFASQEDVDAAIKSRAAQTQQTHDVQQGPRESTSTKEELVPKSGERSDATSALPITVADFAKRLGPPNETLKEAFDKLDVHGDGFIDRAEFAEGARLFVPPLSDNESDHAFEGLDSNDDGNVSVAEFLGTLRVGHFFQAPRVVAVVGAINTATPRAGSRKAHKSMSSFLESMSNTYRSPQHAFSSFDLNADGLLDPEEFSAGTKPFKPPLGNSTAQSCFDFMDSNGDGKVHLAEFLGSLNAEASRVEPGKLSSSSTSTSRSPSSSPSSSSSPSLSSSPPTPHDCDAGYANWKLGWSTAKKSWCCEHRQRGCEDERHQLSTSGGPITLSAFAKLVEAAYASPRVMFEKMDVDEDGMASLSEFTEAVSSFSPPLSRPDAAWAFEGLDTDHDHRLRAAEFIPFVKEAAAATPPQPSPNPGQGLPSHWRSPVERFRVRARKWAGSLRAACRKMDLEGNGRVSLDEFLASVRSFRPPLAARDARAVFTALDDDSDGRVSQRECYGAPNAPPADNVGEQRLQLLGCSDPMFRSADKDSDGMLSRTELFALGAMVDPPVGAGQLSAMLAELDKNQDNYVDRHELGLPSSSLAEQPVQGRHAVRSSDMARYAGVPAIVYGTAEIALSFGAGARAPREGEAEKEVGRLFRLAVEDELDIVVNVASIESVQHEASILEPPKRGAPDRTVMILWTSDVEDGGALQVKLQDHAATVEERVRDGLESGRLRWLRGGSVSVWASCTLDYYGPSASGLPVGKKLTQRFGRKPGESSADGSPAIVLA